MKTTGVHVASAVAIYIDNRGPGTPCIHFGFPLSDYIVSLYPVYSLGYFEAATSAPVDYGSRIHSHRSTCEVHLGSLATR